MINGDSACEAAMIYMRELTFLQPVLGNTLVVYRLSRIYRHSLPTVQQEPSTL